MSLTVRRTGTPAKIDVAAFARRVAAEIPAIIRARVARGVDVFDRPFAPYDRDYAKQEGSTKVDLDAGGPGGLLSTLVVTVRLTADGAVVTVAPDAAHAKVGSFLHRGTPTMKPRPWLGLSPRDLVVLRQRTMPGA